MEVEKTRRDDARWRILVFLNAGRPIGANEGMIFNVLDGMNLSQTPKDVRRELDYLHHKGLVELDRGAIWQARLTADGIDVVEYTVDCPPGIDRPAKWW